MGDTFGGSVPRRGFSAWPLWAIAALASGAALVAYAQVVRFGFVYDDLWSIQRNIHLDEPLRALIAASIGGHAVGAGIPDATRPTMIASIWFDHRLFGERVMFYHLHSLLLHALAAALGVLAAFAITRRRSIAAVAGVWMAVAPLQAEAVASINYREDLLVAGGTLAILAWLCWPSAQRLPSAIRAGIFAAWVFALFAKESAVALALIVAVLALTARGRRCIAAREQDLVVLAAILALWLNWRFGIRALGDDVPVAPQATAASRLADTARFEVQALFSALFPFTSRPEYPRLPHASVWWFAALVPLAALVAVALRRRRWQAAGIGLCVALLAPLAASPLVGPINARADRYLYVCVFGAGLVWGTLLDRVLPAERTPLALAAGAIVLAGFSWRAAAPWSNDLSLWTRAVETAPRSPRAWAALSRLARLRGEYAEAKRLADRAVLVGPDYVPAHVTRLYDAIARGDTLVVRAELDALDRLGGGATPAVARARRCAVLPVEAAQQCIGARAAPEGAAHALP